VVSETPVKLGSSWLVRPHGASHPDGTGSCAVVGSRQLPAAAAGCAHHDAAARDRDHSEAQLVVVGPLLLDDGFAIDRPLHGGRQWLLWVRGWRDRCDAASDGGDCG